MTSDEMLGSSVPPGAGAPPQPAPPDPGPGGFAVPPPQAVADDTRPEPGSLNLRGKRSWKTWQLTVFLVVACLLGMWFAWWINGSSGSATSNGSGSTYKLPTEGASGGSAATGGAAGTGTGTATAGKAGTRSGKSTTAAGSTGASTTTTTSAGGSTATGGSAAAGATTTTQPLGQEAYLVPAHQASGNWTSPAFNIAGSTWYIGWAFQCNPVPAVRPLFSVYVVTPGASPSGTPAVSSSASQGQSVTNLTSTGSQELVVQAPPQCEWVVKVTGYGGT